MCELAEPFRAKGFVLIAYSYWETLPRTGQERPETPCDAPGSDVEGMISAARLRP